MDSIELSTRDARPYAGQTSHWRKVAQAAAEQLSSGKRCQRPPHKTTEAQKHVLLDEFERNPNPGASKQEHLGGLLMCEYPFPSH
ncbi:hypothetical protein JB92DRAFT_1197403 [Gautieria morchelliformis]|nr:hypothetical protein JB92DRAFT_1197403 [Gautieria morchelliformis]